MKQIYQRKKISTRFKLYIQMYSDYITTNFVFNLYNDKLEFPLNSSVLYVEFYLRN
ncbi:unnamed protein product (macronuclear) [Paramecium tetraurelia]|uniref:Chromosome undetermined scaffold_208, whole genome shotgun sequence n=1 Tax=Paramecium tetraurelia TaxID=5888 RepID=A0CLU6_PARTE|nr:uncharacterized protein GSPATT00038688001 [Paramecium tetraurelia]XP_001448832.1 uncharacterized protein GSPATT00016261001 [Paramecium tetraurelia]CAK71763.1 unnamed protein product [Paramecium tetraurelia]CAK81435.1 unnamed protein product [Paramecium tetraurelia]|eukprot:XP_001439160.1 hypothetical protein (macronuclear) [Paramecium tetraurelia strain d4-2]